MIIAAILAGGKGLRLGSNVPKQLLPLGGKKVIQWSVDTFHSCDMIDEIIIVSDSTSITTIRDILDSVKYPKITGIIEGGRERVDSSAKAVFYKNYNPDDIFLIHDAARPFITVEIIIDCIKTVKTYDAAGAYIPSRDTIAVVNNNFVESIPDRRSIFSAQTPQAFKYHVIKESQQSYQLNRYNGITDDVSLAKANGFDVKIIDGSDINFKITTEFDYKIAEFMIDKGIVKVR